MTQEEKAKAYDKAIKRAKALYDSHQPISGNNVIIDNIFPELRKSEDEYLEKIKKDIISYLNNRKIDTIPESSATEKWIDWLEKQKLTKNINKEDEEVRQYLIRTMKQKDINVPMVQKALDWLKKQGRQKPAWSEKDEQHIDSLLKRLEGLCRNEFERTRFAISEDENWLKSFKQRIGG